VAIELPSELTWTMRAFGFQWPDLNEDHFREAASHLRQYARDASTSIDATHRRMRDLREVYESDSYEALVSAWGSQTRGHLPCRLWSRGATTWRMRWTSLRRGSSR
jgi:hypothetical protein